jgi:tRNA pseudouridine38-40 synthase
VEPDAVVERRTPPAAERWRLEVAYDGSAFRGFAAQPGVATVAGALGAALARVARSPDPPVLTCAGRTDAGVHARGQVVHVDLPVADRAGGQAALSPDTLVRSLNRQLAPAVVVRRAARVGADFDARRCATGRHYRYLVWNAPTPDPLWAALSWHVVPELEVRAMAAAADALIGQHDFRSFCRRPPGTSSSEPIVRVVRRAEWRVLGGPEFDTPGTRMLRFDIEAGSFCHQMVRSLVSALVAVGRGRLNVAGLVARLRAAERTGSLSPAPPNGLCLVAVSYAAPGPGDRAVSTTDPTARP